ncbi:MAG: cell division/cell wall cluster transcriptional repressor MraZ [Clostridia bacterium]|jgi:MraZ protein|nr:cell division/cell wall cluster transcriptional repressor MraZ [Clostridia bacterium]
MFLGSFEHQVDQKGRMRLPASFRSEMKGDDIVAVQGANRAIYIYSTVDLNEELSEYEKVGFADSDKTHGMVMRLISASAHKISEDNQGRFTLTQRLRAFANIRKDIVFIGSGKRIELWDKENWENYSNCNDEDFDSLLLKLTPKKKGDSDGDGSIQS